MTTLGSLPQPSLLGPVLRYWAFVVVLVVTGVLVGGIAARVLASEPSATALVVVSDPRPGITHDGTMAARYALEQAAIITSELVIQPTRLLLLRAAPPINLSSQALRGGLTVSSATSNNVLKISFSDKSGVRAARVANAIVHQYRAVYRQTA